MKRRAGGEGQRSLFGDGSEASAPSAPRPSDRLALAPVPDDLRSVAGRLPASIRLGTSSWSFPGWEGIVWDRACSERVLARRGLEVYARHPLFRAVGLDRTYYAPVTSEALASYAAAVPEDFRILVKAASLVTDPFVRATGGRPREVNARFLDGTWAADLVVGPYVEGLGSKGGALVFQFPPLGREIAGAPERFASRLRRFLAALPKGPAYRIELRDRGLLVPDYAAALEDSGAGHCVSIHPRAGSFSEQVGLPLGAEGPTTVRWMLHSGLAYEVAREKYAPFDRLVDDDPTSRDAIAALCRESAGWGRDVIVVANNKAEGSAPLSLFRLAARIVG